MTDHASRSVVACLLGEGEMRQVYQATDTKLNRQVGLQDPSQAFTSDPDAP